MKLKVWYIIKIGFYSIIVKDPDHLLDEIKDLGTDSQIMKVCSKSNIYIYI